MTLKNYFAKLTPAFAVCFSSLLFASHAVLAQDDSVSDDSADTKQECIAPANTPIIPDGNVASRDELLAAQDSIKAFQLRNLAFLDCAHARKAALVENADENADAIQEVDAAIDKAVALEESVANEFNTARKHFMER